MWSHGSRSQYEPDRVDMSQVEPTAEDGRVRAGGIARLRGVLALVVGIGCVTYLVHLLWTRRDGIGRALDLDWTTLSVLLGLMFASHVQRAFEVDYMLRRLGVKERLVDGFMLTGAAYLLNYLPFNAGSVARAVTLTRTDVADFSS